jgi:phosphohistidine phosphatase SixA
VGKSSTKHKNGRMAARSSLLHSAVILSCVWSSTANSRRRATAASFATSATLTRTVKANVRSAQSSSLVSPIAAPAGRQRHFHSGNYATELHRQRSRPYPLQHRPSSSFPMSDPSKSSEIAASQNVLTVDVFPFETCLQTLCSLPMYECVKVVHFLRHAEGTHNVNRQYRDIGNLDAELTSRGKEQCEAFASSLRAAHSSAQQLIHLREETEIIVSSPLTRCLQTTLLCSDPIHQGPATLRQIVALDWIRETVNYNCDRRRSLQQLRHFFAAPNQLIDFSHVATEHDDIWSEYVDRLGDDSTYTWHRESSEIYKVALRARKFLILVAGSTRNKCFCVLPCRIFAMFLVLRY